MLPDDCKRRRCRGGYRMTRVFRTYLCNSQSDFHFEHVTWVDGELNHLNFYRVGLVSTKPCPRKTCLGTKRIVAVRYCVCTVARFNEYSEFSAGLLYFRLRHGADTNLTEEFNCRMSLRSPSRTRGTARKTMPCCYSQGCGPSSQLQSLDETGLDETGLLEASEKLLPQGA
jgi:hypothetical protein